MIQLWMLGLALLAWLPTCESYLKAVEGYAADSYFKEEVYRAHTWQTFGQLPEPNQAMSETQPDLHLLNAALFFATNELRHRYKKPEFRYSATLRDAAVVHTHEMVSRHFFSHTNSRNRKWDKPDSRIRQCGPLPRALAENIDYQYLEEGDTYLSFARKVVQHLYDSPPHRKNMLGSYTHLGTCSMMEAKDRQGYRYLKSTQDFATY